MTRSLRASLCSDRSLNVFARVLDDELHGFWAFVCGDSDVSRLSPEFSTLVIFFAIVVCRIRFLRFLWSLRGNHLHECPVLYLFFAIEPFSQSGHVYCKFLSLS